jgi:catechol 2,3-dioxygenase-like lactoylglutathione lyase family enzyme
MQTHLAHIQFNVQPDNVPFYRDLMAFLGWQTIYDGEGMLGVAGPNQDSIWFLGQAKPVQNDYDGPGMNHLAIGTSSQADVDVVATYLRERGVRLLFETPRHRPEFSQSPEQTYYQVMFESPDRILLEIVYTGPLAA